MYRNVSSFNRSQWDWRTVFNTQTPQGRFAVLVALLVMLGIISVGRSISQSDGISARIALYLGRAIALLIGFTLHEWAHAQVAYRLGGYSALPDTRRLSLNPLVHLEPMGIFLALTVGFGWAKPVPVYPNAFYPNERRGMMYVALAGPAMNLLIALVVAIVMRILLGIGIFESIPFSNFAHGGGSLAHFIYQLLSVICSFNIFLALFNLLPLAPLDGWKIMLGLLPVKQSIALGRYEYESNMLLWFLILLGFVRLSPLWPILSPLSNALFSIFTGFEYLL